MLQTRGLTRIAEFGRMLIVATLIAATIAALPRSSAGAQESGLLDDSTYVFALDGTQVSWQGDWEFEPSSSGQFEGYETASLVTSLAGLLIGEIQSGTPLDLDAFLAVVLDTVAADSDEFVTVDRSATDIVSYSLDAAVIDGIPAGLFTYVQPNLQTGNIIFTSLLSERSTFADNIADAQANVTVGGRVALEGIDGQILQNLLPNIPEGDGSRDTDDSDDPDSQSVDGDEEADDENRPRFEPDVDEDAAEDNDDRGSEIDDDLGELGLVDEGLYESPQYGNEIEWSGGWELNEDFLSSDGDDEVDNVALVINDGEAVVLISFFEAGDATPADYAAFWESDEFVEENASDEAEVLLADSSRRESGVLIADPLEDGTELWALRQAYSLDGGDTIAIVIMIGLDSVFLDALADAQDDITLDGDPVLSLFSVEDVEDVR